MQELTQDRIGSMTATELANSVIDLYDIDSQLKREILVMSIEERAKSLGCIAQVRKILKQAADDHARFNGPCTVAPVKNDGIMLSLNPSTGKPEQTIDNFMRILRGDPYFTTLRYNEFAASEEITRECKTYTWRDGHDAAAMDYIQITYQLFNEQMYRHAFRELMMERTYHPVREYIDAIKWDGKPRISNFLMNVVHAEDTPYIREVSRILFAEGIHRIYEPGCKADYVPVMIGTRQGEGKTTLVKWLAIKEEWSSELSEIEGQRGIEAIQGTFVCEVGEMLAMVKAREVESVKAYFSRQVDKYRVPYDRRPMTYARQCIFVGNTNREQFLTDKTGNRRFLPVHVHMTGKELYERELEIREYIIQCWAEAKANMRTAFMSTAPDYSLINEIQRHQRNATEYDWREDAIAEYLDKKRPGEFVCIDELWRDALSMGAFDRPSKGESAELGIIMQQFEDWTRTAEPTNVPRYGTKRTVWMKSGDTCPF